VIHVDKTTIQVSLETKKVLDDIKVIEREPYDDVIRRLLQEVLDRCEEGGDKETKGIITQRLCALKRGEAVSTHQLKGRLFGTKDKYEVRESLDKRNRK
jgi:hypothetical protein